VVTPNAAGILDNMASVAGNEHDPDTLNNSDIESTVVNLADLSITKANSADPALAWSPLTYTLVVANDGPADATGVTVTDTLPVSTIFGSADITAGTCDEASGSVTCNVGDLTHGAVVTATMVVTPTIGGTITNTASVAGNEPDYLYNNLAMESTTIRLGHLVYLPLVLR